MALKARDQIKTVFGTGPLTLKADPGESLLIKAIKSYHQTASWLTLKTEKTTVGYFAIQVGLRNHLNFPLVKNNEGNVVPPLHQNLLDYLTAKGIFKGYPVAEGETFLMQPSATGGGDIASVVYDIYDAEDQKNTSPNGSKATEYMLINYGDTGANIQAAGDHLYDNPVNPVEFPSFPFAADVPAKHQVTIHGILGSEGVVLNATPEVAIYTKYLKLIKDREVLFDEDRNGIPFASPIGDSTPGAFFGIGYSLIGEHSDRNSRPPLLFTDPLVFDAGDELNIYVTVAEPVDGSAIGQTDQIIGIIETITRITG